MHIARTVLVYIVIFSMYVYRNETVSLQHYHLRMLRCMIRILALIDTFDIRRLDGLSEKSAGSNCTQDPADQCVANASCANNKTCTCEDRFYQDGGVCTASKCE